MVFLNMIFARSTSMVLIGKSEVKDTLGRPNRNIRGFIAKLETSRTRKQLELKLSEYVDNDLQSSVDRISEVKYPGLK